MAKKKKKPVTKKFTTAATVKFSKEYNVVISDEPRVCPGDAYVLGGQKVVWWNTYKYPVRVEFDHDGVLGGPKFDREIDPGKSKKAPGNASSSKTGSHKYKVIDMVTGDEIPGNSPPDIIIE